MLAWLKSWFRSQDPFDAYQPGERLIYKYFDGTKMVRADPLVLYKWYAFHGPELLVDLKVSGSPSKDANSAHTSAVAKIREMFEVKTLKEGGLSDFEVMDLLDHFLYYCDHIKKKSNRLRTPSTPSAASNGTSQDGQASFSTLASGSAASVPGTGKPEPSPMGQPSP